MTDSTTATAERVTASFALDFFGRWCEAWNSHELDAVLALTTEDVQFDDSGWPKTMNGHAEVSGYIRHLWGAFPDVSFDKLDGPFISETSAKAGFLWRSAGTFTGPLGPFQPTGKRFQFDGFEILEFRGDRVSRWQDIEDMAHLYRQIGVG